VVVRCLEGGLHEAPMPAVDVAVHRDDGVTQFGEMGPFRSGEHRLVVPEQRGWPRTSRTLSGPKTATSAGFPADDAGHVAVLAQ